MNKGSSIILVVFFACFLITACKSKKGLFSRKKAIVSNYNFYSDSISSPIPYKYLSFKVQSKFDGESIKLPVKSVKSTIKIYKDSLIWVSITALLGIEAARAQIKNDSIFLLNRLNSTYTYGPISSFIKQLPEQTSISTLAQILLGKPIIPNTEIKPKFLNQVNDLITIKGNSTLIPSNSLNGATYTSTHHKDIPVLNTQKITSLPKGQSISINYSEVKTVTLADKPHLIPFKQEFLINGSSPITIVNTYSKMNSERQSFNFKVPKSYKRIAY